jgi:uncharacterized membrane protein YhaH (DUF805 family)
MLNEFAYAGDSDPRQALSRARELVRRVRAAQRATWFPLLVLAAVIASIPVERYGGCHTVTCKVLAWAERNIALLVFTVGYLVILLAPTNFGWVLSGRSAFIPQLVIPAGLLLLGAIGFGLAQRLARLPAA